MASTVLTGTTPTENRLFSYKNNTGKNVRLVINYMSFGSFKIGKNLAYRTPKAFESGSDNIAFVLPQLTPSNISQTNYYATSTAEQTEIYLGPNQTYEKLCIEYNIVVIPEDG